MRSCCFDFRFLARRGHRLAGSLFAVLFATAAAGAVNTSASVAAEPVSATKPDSRAKPASAPKPHRTKGQTDAQKPLHRYIDELIAAGTPNYEQIAAPIADDAEFVRRVYLDLTGMIPTAEQVRAFLADQSPDKREQLIDRLLDTAEYARHMQRRFDVMLMRRLPQRNVPAGEWRQFLRDSFAQNKPWDEMVREMLSADGTDPKNRGPASFYLDRNGDADELTRDIGRIFLGADLACAQCHNHPEVDDYLQTHYYGISAFLVRSYVFTDKKKKRKILAEKAVGEVSFENVFEAADKKGKDKSTKTTEPAIFNLTMPEEPNFKKGTEYVTKPSKKTAGVPKFSRREFLPKLITSPKNERFTRTAANRLWAMFMGRGLVHPLDRDHSDNPPSHPELLQLLTDQFRNHNYDIKWYVRQLLLSKTYQRSSRVASKPGGRVPPESAFAQAMLRPLTPEQFAWSILQATGETDVHRRALGKKLTEAALHKRLNGYEKRFVSLFGGEPGKPPEEFETTVDQVLFLSNDDAMAKLLKPKSGNLADRLLKLPADQPEKIAEELFLSVLSRTPTKQDIADVRNFLKGQTGDARQTAMQDLIWALITSSEFRFNQ